MNRVTLGGLACGLALILAACGSSGLSDNGPFGNGGPNSGTICLLAKMPGGVTHDSFDAFPNRGGTATIEKVALVHPRHIRLIAAWVVPTHGSFGNAGPGYPSASAYPPGIWARRLRIPGAVVRHTRGQDLLNLVLVMRPSGEFGTAMAVNLYYKSGGTRYLLHFPYGYKIEVGHKCD